MKKTVLAILGIIAFSVISHGKEFGREPITLNCKVNINQQGEKVSIERTIVINPFIDSDEVIYQQKNGMPVVAVVSNYRAANGDEIITAGVFLNNTSTGVSARDLTVREFDAMKKGEVIFDANWASTQLHCTK